MPREEADEALIGTLDVAIVGCVEGQMEALDEVELLPLVVGVGAQQERAEGRAQRQGVHR